MDYDADVRYGVRCGSLFPRVESRLKVFPAFICLVKSQPRAIITYMVSVCHSNIPNKKIVEIEKINQVAIAAGAFVCGDLTVSADSTSL